MRVGLAVLLVVALAGFGGGQGTGVGDGGSASATERAGFGERDGGKDGETRSIHMPVQSNTILPKLESEAVSGQNRTAAHGQRC